MAIIMKHSVSKRTQHRVIYNIYRVRQIFESRIFPILKLLLSQILDAPCILHTNLRLLFKLCIIYIYIYIIRLKEQVCGEEITLPPVLLDGATICHNQESVSSRGVVQVPAGDPDDLPHWMLAAMRFLAHCK